MTDLISPVSQDGAIAYEAGPLSRRSFIQRIVALGVATSTLSAALLTQASRTFAFFYVICAGKSGCTSDDGVWTGSPKFGGCLSAYYCGFDTGVGTSSVPAKCNAYSNYQAVSCNNAYGGGKGCDIPATDCCACLSGECQCRSKCV